MAKNGSKSVTVTNYDTLKFSWEESSQDITNNKTTIKWKLQLIATTYGAIISTASKDWSVTVNGTKYSGTNTIGIENNETKTLASGTTTIAHNSDGSKTFSYSFSQEIAITFHGEYVGTKSGSGSGTLDTIPRKSTLSVADGTLGTEQTLTVTRQSDDFTHTIIATCGDQTKTICEKSSSTSIKFTPPLDWASTNTTGTSVSVTYKITTYNGSTSVGSNSYTKTCSIPSSVKPTVSFTVEDSEGYAGIFGNYVQTLSKAKVVITASKSHGSPIKSYSTTIDGKTYTSDSFTTSALSGTGTLTIKTTVTDSRGRTASESKTIEVTAYEVPKITEVTLKRCNSDGTSNPSGEHVAVVFTTSVTPLDNKNTAAYSVQYKKTTESNYVEKPITDYSNQYSVTNGVFIFEAAPRSSYDVIFVVEDKIVRKQKTLSVSAIGKHISILKVGFGLALGKIAELADVLDIGFQTRFMGGILQPILANGTDFDSIMTPNTYSGRSASASEYVNCPISSSYSFALEVIAAGDNNQLIQRVTTFNKSLPVTYERIYSGGSWGAWKDNNPYPVGSIYMSVNNKNPSTLFGGTWEQIKDVFLLAAGNTYAAGSTGGEATHTLTVEEMPEHQHSLYYRSIYADDGSTSAITSKSYGDGNTSKANGTLATGEGNAHNNMPPYLAVYVWKRIS